MDLMETEISRDNIADVRIENISILGSLEILPSWNILSFKPVGEGVSTFFIHAILLYV